MSTELRATFVATLITVLAVVGILLVPKLAHAEMRDYQKSGIWKNAAGITEDTKEPMCVLSTMTDETGVFIKYTSDGSYWLTLVKQSWRIPDGTNISIEIGFDKDSWNAIDDAKGDTVKKSNYIYGRVMAGFQEGGAISSFMDQFSQANKMWIKFGGTERPWVFDMTGSHEAMAAFGMCAVKVRSKSPSQPFTSDKGTQPFDSKKPTTIPSPTTERGA